MITIDSETVTLSISEAIAAFTDNCDLYGKSHTEVSFPEDRAALAEVVFSEHFKFSFLTYDENGAVSYTRYRMWNACGALMNESIIPDGMELKTPGGNLFYDGTSCEWIKQTFIDRYVIASCTACHLDTIAVKLFNDSERVYNPFGYDEEEVFDDLQSAREAFRSKYANTELWAEGTYVWCADFQIIHEVRDEEGDLVDEETLDESHIPANALFPVSVNGVKLRFNSETNAWE